MGTCCSEPAAVTDIYRDCTDENTPYVTYEDVRAVVKVVRIVDGDTLDVVMKQEPHNKAYKYRVRLYGIDTPESKPPLSQVNRNEEIAAAQQSKEALKQQLVEVNHYVTIHFHKFDKYGRLLGTVYGKDGININQWMIKNNHAVAYYGKTKTAFESRTILSSINSH